MPNYKEIKELNDIDDKTKYKKYAKRILELKKQIEILQSTRVLYAKEIMQCQDEQQKLIERSLKKG